MGADSYERGIPVGVARVERCRPILEAKIMGIYLKVPALGDEKGYVSRRLNFIYKKKHSFRAVSPRKIAGLT